jgi:hypothetical protein
MSDPPKMDGHGAPPVVPMPAPGWDAGRPAAAFQAFAGQVRGMARQVFLRDGRHAEMLFFMPLNGQGHVVLWRSNDRDLEAGWIRKHITEPYVFGVVHVVEAWMHLARTPDDHTLRQIQAGEIKVSELCPADRREALMVSAQSRDGWSASWIAEIARDAAGKPSLGTSREFADFRGRFGKLFG